MELNKRKTDMLVSLTQDSRKPGMGMVAGISNGIMKSPFSAPFGGFHFKKAEIYSSEIDIFINDLKEYIMSNNLKGIEIILPPDIYQHTFNTKIVNSFMRNGFNHSIPDITNWVNLKCFDGVFKIKSSKELYKQAIRNKLVFESSSLIEEQKNIYEIIQENRARFNRPIFMTFEDIKNTGEIWPIDYFKVTSSKKEIVASAIFYRSHPEIIYAAFWGDSENGRSLRAMDFLAFNLWSFYKELGYKYVDLGTSTELGIPNEGLLRFKESHESTSSLRYKFSWNI